MDVIRELVKQYKEIVHSERNQKNKEFWEDHHPWLGWMYRGVPKADFKRPFVINPETTLWSPIFNNLNLKDYHTDPVKWLEIELRLRIYKYDNWKDNTYFEDCLYFAMFEWIRDVNLFGQGMEFFDDRDPWIPVGAKPVLSDKKKLEYMELPNFYKSGFMPKIHDYYKLLQDRLNGDLDLIFPYWVRGPLCIAVSIRGMENLLIDMVTDQDFVHRLMRFIVDTEKHWTIERGKFLGEPSYPKGYMADDEVGAPLISPAMYEEMVLSYESEIARFRNGLWYWHSCGDTRDFFDLIKKIPDVEMIHVSPWSDDKSAVEAFSGKLKEIAFERPLHPSKEFFEISNEEIESNLRKLKDIYRDAPRLFFNINGIGRMHKLEYDLAKIDDFIQIYGRVFDQINI